MAQDWLTPCFNLFLVRQSSLVGWALPQLQWSWWNVPTGATRTALTAQCDLLNLKIQADVTLFTTNCFRVPRFYSSNLIQLATAAGGTALTCCLAAVGVLGTRSTQAGGEYAGPDQPDMTAGRESGSVHVVQKAENAAAALTARVQARVSCRSLRRFAPGKRPALRAGTTRRARGLP